MRVIRSSNQNVSPSDDAKLFRSAHTDGLFESASITSLGSNQVSIPALYGIMQGRDFTSEAQTLLVTLPTADTGTGYVIGRFNTATTDVISFTSQLAPYTPVYDDINTTGTVCEMIIATYTATPVAITAISNSYALSSLNATNIRDVTNITVPTTAFVADTTFTNYPFKADITVAGATANDVPEVQPSQDASDLGILGGKALASAGIVTIYAKAVPSAAIVIDRITLRKENA